MGFIVDSKYRASHAIGEGGMGAVYDAVHTKTGRRVALKMIHEDAWSDDARRRFEREARAAGAIESLHIAQVLDSGEDAATGSPYIVMEYLSGEDLRGLLRRRGPLPPELALAIIGQALLGLAKAHEADIVHRDLKPANVFLANTDDDRCVVKVLDFGIAKVVGERDDPKEDGSALERIESDEDIGTLTRTSCVIGSPPYMSPEQLRAARDVDARTDIWSMGVVLYEALSGKTPTAHYASLEGKVRSILRDPPRPLIEVAPRVPKDVAALVHRALDRDRGKRFTTAREMLQAVRALLGASLDLTADAIRGDEALDSTRQQPLRLEAANATTTLNDNTPVAPLEAPATETVTTTLPTVDPATTHATAPMTLPMRDVKPMQVAPPPVAPKSRSGWVLPALGLGAALAGLAATAIVVATRREPAPPITTTTERVTAPSPVASEVEPEPEAPAVSATPVTAAPSASVRVAPIKRPGPKPGSRDRF